MADDLVQRLRNSPPREICEHKLQKVKCPHCENDALEDALARKDAEIAAANAEIDELVRALKLCTQRAERAEARVREAPVVEASPRSLPPPWVGNMPHATIAVTGDVAKRIGGKRVALVLLDTEEAK